MIAYGRVEGSGPVYGLAWNYSDLISAVKKAMEVCKGDARGRLFSGQCVPRAWARNGCVAIATGDFYHGFGVGPSKAVAERQALYKCGVGCRRIKASECSRR